MNRSAVSGNSQVYNPPPPPLAGCLRDGRDRVDDDRNVEGRRPLPRSRSGVSPRVAPEFHDQIAEAIDDVRVLTETRCAVDVSHCADPLRDAIEVPEFALERCEHRETGQTCGLVPLVDSQVPADEALGKRRGPSNGPCPAI